jgi:hypothetical protein
LGKYCFLFKPVFSPAAAAAQFNIYNYIFKRWCVVVHIKHYTNLCLLNIFDDRHVCLLVDIIDFFQIIIIMKTLRTKIYSEPQNLNHQIYVFLFKKSSIFGKSKNLDSIFVAH